MSTNKPKTSASTTLIDQTIELGKHVRCIASGVEGTIVQLMEYADGLVQFGIQRKAASESHEPPELFYTDSHHLECTGKPGLTHKVTPPDFRAIHYLIGAEARLISNKKKGVIVNKFTYINGCISYALMFDDKDGMPVRMIVRDYELEFIKMPKKAQVHAPLPEGQKPTGCAPVRMSAFRR